MCVCDVRTYVSVYVNTYMYVKGEEQRRSGYKGVKWGVGTEK